MLLLALEVYLIRVWGEDTGMIYTTLTPSCRRVELIVKSNGQKSCIFSLYSPTDAHI